MARKCEDPSYGELARALGEALQLLDDADVKVIGGPSYAHGVYERLCEFYRPLVGGYEPEPPKAEPPASGPPASSMDPDDARYLEVD